MPERTEFGVPRSSCGCAGCVTNCRHMPGFLIPADLDRMIPDGTDPLAWAAEHLRASPGALVMKDGEAFRIPTLVPAPTEDGSCHNLTAERLCSIHEVAPFGCAFFSCGPEVPGLAAMGINAVAIAHRENALYSRIWVHLYERGLRQQKAEVLRARMREALA